MSLYKQTVPVMIKYMHNLSSLLNQGVKFCDEKGIPHEELLSARIIDDMRGIPYQVQSASNSAKFTLQRLGGMSIPYFEDDETTFEQLQARIDTTIKFLEGADPKCMDGVEDKEVMMETRGPKFKFETGQRYVSEYQMPKFYFHIVTTYCILRQRGVPIDMVDYLKDVLVMVE